jgi:hypothetical protein
LKQWKSFVPDVLELYTQEPAPIGTYLELMKELRVQAADDKAFIKEYSEVIVLSKISETAPMDNSDCERTFSFKKKIAVPLRSSMTTDHVEDATVIAVESRRQFQRDDQWQAKRFLKSMLPRARQLFKVKRRSANKRKRPDPAKEQKMEDSDSEKDASDERLDAEVNVSMNEVFARRALDPDLNAGARKALFAKLDLEEKEKQSKRRKRAEIKRIRIAEKMKKELEKRKREEAELSSSSDDNDDDGVEMPDRDDSDSDFDLIPSDDGDDDDDGNDDDNDHDLLALRPKSKRCKGPAERYEG